MYRITSHLPRPPQRLEGCAAHPGLLRRPRQGVRDHHLRQGLLLEEAELCVV